MSDVTSEVKSEMKFGVNDKVIVSRGKYKGETGTVRDVDAAREQYAIKLDNGTLTVQNAVNVKDPNEGASGVSLHRLAAIVAGVQKDDSVDIDDAFGELIRRLLTEVPGFHEAYDAAHASE